jgi:hypothetical protein
MKQQLESVEHIELCGVDDALANGVGHAEVETANRQIRNWLSTHVAP